MEINKFETLTMEEEQSIDGGGILGAIAGAIIGGVGGIVVGTVACVADAVISRSSPNIDIIGGCGMAGFAVGVKVGAAVPGGFY